MWLVGETKELTSFEQFNIKTQVLWFKVIDRPEQPVCFKLPFFDIISSNLLNSVWNDQFVSKLALLDTKFVTFTEISMGKVWKLKEKQFSCFSYHSEKRLKHLTFLRKFDQNEKIPHLKFQPKYFWAVK